MKKIVLPLMINMVCHMLLAQVQVSGLLCENLSNPVGLDVPQPRFSWQIASSKRNTMQAGYEIRVLKNHFGGDVINVAWNSGKVNSDSSVHVAYKGSQLQSDTKYFCFHPMPGALCTSHSPMPWQ